MNGDDWEYGKCESGVVNKDAGADVDAERQDGVVQGISFLRHLGRRHLRIKLCYRLGYCFYG